MWKMYANQGYFDNDKKIKDYSEEDYNKLVYAKPEKVTLNFLDGEMNSTYEGLVERFIRQNIKTEREKSEANQKKSEKFTTTCTCPACGGKRYNEVALSSRIMGYSIYDLT